MGGREPPKCVPEKEEVVLEEPTLLLLKEEVPPSLCGMKLLVDCPILLLVFFHKAMLAELEELRRLAEVASEGKGSAGRHLIVVDFRWRFEFLKIVYNYHCAAEDEVIFMALNSHIRNVSCTYTLEHRSIDDLFNSISDCLNVLMEIEESTSKQLQELLICIGTIQALISQHMLKEEKQVFPLLVQQFSTKEQASLIWQVLCYIPITLLEDLLPWLSSFLSPLEQEDILHCIKEVVPQEKLLQEVVIDWLHKKKSFSFAAYNEFGEGANLPNSLASSKDLIKWCASKSFNEEKWWLKKTYSETTVQRNPIDGLRLWHCAIRNDLKGILKDLYQIKRSQEFSTLDLAIVQLKFFTDVLIFYSMAWDKTFNPLVNELANGILSHSLERFQVDGQIEGLQRLLYHKNLNGKPLGNYVEKVCGELELFVTGISEHFSSLEKEVFPFISKKFANEFQQLLLYTSVRSLPIGLLKCMVNWFSSHLSEDECNSILDSLKPEGPPADDKSFTFLLCEWIRRGYSGKASIDQFRKELLEMFKTRSFFLTKHAKENDTCSSLFSTRNPCNSSKPGEPQPHTAVKANEWMSTSSSSNSSPSQKYGTPYSNIILLPFPKISYERSGTSSIINLEPRPVDHIFFFHKAIKKDLEYLVNVSAKLGENVGDLVDFCRRFKLVRFLYKIHSDLEDEIAFPALEAKGKATNITRSYTIDHKLEVDLFGNVSLILDELSGLHVSVDGIKMDVLDERMLIYKQLCLKLHDICKSMNKVVSDHVNREEVELWPLFRECLSSEEQEKIIGCMLGRTRAEILQEMIPWLMASLTTDEQQAIMSLWRTATRNTMFDDWLKEWWEGMKRYDISKVEVEPKDISTSWNADPHKMLSLYLLDNAFDDRDRKVHEKSEVLVVFDKGQVSTGKNNDQFSNLSGFSGGVERKKSKESAETKQADKPSEHVQVSQDFRHQEHLPAVRQEELEATIRKLSRDSTMDPQKKSYIIQNLLMSRWITTQQKSHTEVPVSSKGEKAPGQSPSYKDPIKLVFGCGHYNRKCKLVAACCNRLYTCRHCHDDVADHTMERKATAKMMCMECLVIQPIGPTCSTAACNNLSMAKYYCRICKLFDDERDIYHCPYCNLCRVGKGLGIDYFHCMTCNACMSRSLSVHKCRVKCFEDNCPICNEYIFTSSSPVKALACGHLMHSACFQDYTCTHYTCPICSKSLGDMQVYFGMLDAHLAEEKIPDEYSGRTQAILCNDCEKRGTTSFHWLYHKCPHCGSYNTRLL